jgi:hypothetical protein
MKFINGRQAGLGINNRTDGRNQKSQTGLHKDKDDMHERLVHHCIDVWVKVSVKNYHKIKTRWL